MRTPVTSIRLPQEQLHGLKVLARKEAVRRGRDVTWATIVRELVEDRLRREQEDEVAAPVPP
jgi:predicted DNA-binding protein